MTVSFTVQACAVRQDEDINTFMVVLADSASQPVQVLELQRSLEFDDQDVELGMDTYCIVTNFGETYYGGINSCILEGDSLSIGLSDEAKAVLGVDSFLLSLELASSERILLASGLERLFRDDRNVPADLRLK